MVDCYVCTVRIVKYCTLLEGLFVCIVDGQLHAHTLK
jgi:hypothetical protein